MCIEAFETKYSKLTFDIIAANCIQPSCYFENKEYHDVSCMVAYWQMLEINLIQYFWIKWQYIWRAT